ncbi:MAG: hypothetical protein HY068_08470 [Burkholderiales bacterium]|nr:hypothetical protein [Burkholderiales bacterium]
MAAEAGLVGDGSTGHGVLQAGNGPAVTLTPGAIALMLTMLLDQVVELAAARIEHTGQMQGNVGDVVGVGLTELVSPLFEKLPFVSALFRHLDGIFVHNRNTKMEEMKVFPAAKPFLQAGWFRPSPCGYHV